MVAHQPQERIDQKQYVVAPSEDDQKRGVENLTNDTPPKQGFWTPPRTVRFPPPSGVSALSFLYKKLHNRADQKLFWRGPKIFGRARSLVRFPPPIRFAPLHITAQPTANGLSWPPPLVAKTLFGFYLLALFPRCYCTEISRASGWGQSNSCWQSVSSVGHFCRWLCKRDFL